MKIHNRPDTEELKARNRPNAEELKDKLINLLEEREEVASKFQDCHDDGEWEKTQSLAMEWWRLCEEIGSAKKRMARSIEKSGE